MIDIAFDSKKILADGSLQVDGYLASFDSVYYYQTTDNQRIGIYRPRNIVASPFALASSEDNPVTLHHPTVDGKRILVDSTNYMRYARGYIKGKARVDEFLKKTVGTLIIKDKHAVDSILNQGIKGLSNGYRWRLIKKEGISADGKPFHFVLDFVQNNHTALTPVPRGDDAHIIDSIDDIPIDAMVFDTNYTSSKIIESPEPFKIAVGFDSKKKEKKSVLRELNNGAKIDVPDDFVNTFDSVTSGYDSQIISLSDENKTLKGQLAVEKANNKKLQEAQDKVDFDNAWDSANSYLPASAKKEDYDNETELKKAALLSVYGTDSGFDSDDPVFINGAFKTLQLSKADAKKKKSNERGKVQNNKNFKPVYEAITDSNGGRLDTGSQPQGSVGTDSKKKKPAVHPIIKHHQEFYSQGGSK